MGMVTPMKNEKGKMKKPDVHPRTSREYAAYVGFYANQVCTTHGQERHAALAKLRETLTQQLSYLVLFKELIHLLPNQQLQAELDQFNDMVQRLENEKLRLEIRQMETAK